MAADTYDVPPSMAGSYERFRPATVTIPAEVFQARARALLEDLGETPEGQLVVFSVSWVRLQLEAERAAL